jgi:hypothetical protein
MTPAAIRNRLIDALRIDLVGPALPDEQLDQNPTRWYLTSFLAPLNAGPDQRGDLSQNEALDLAGAPPRPPPTTRKPTTPAPAPRRFPPRSA